MFSGALAKLKDRGWWMSMVYYLVLIIATTLAFAYGVLTFKVYFYETKIKEIDGKIAVYSTPQEKAHEKQVFDYKKKIDDFAAIINSHKITTNVFSFIEDYTLPRVWFSSFNMSETTNEVRVAGETENMETLSRQFKALETANEYVKHISVLSSQVDNAGKVSFILNLFLQPSIFAYNEKAFLPASVTPVPTSPPAPTQ